MNVKELQKYVKTSRFLADFCGIADSANTRHKTNGKDTRGMPYDFTPEEKKKIKEGWRNFKRTFK